jgi:hypothetical protein
MKILAMHQYRRANTIKNQDKIVACDNEVIA